MLSERQKLEQKSGKKKEKKKEAKPESTPLLLPSSLGSGSYCTPDQCFLSGPQATPPQLLTSNSQTFFGQQAFTTPAKNHRQENIYNNSTADKAYSFSDFLPPDLYELIKEAAKQGLLLSFLLTLPSELVSDYLKTQHYQAEHIYWINQILRSLTLITFGSSAGLTLALPLLNYLLSTQAGISKEKSNLLTTGTALTAGLLSSPLGLLSTSLSMATSLGTGWAGSKASQYAYHLIRTNLFSSRNTETKQTLLANENVALEKPKTKVKGL